MDCPDCGTAKVGVRIVGGKETPPHRYPWMASLADERMSPFCGASLINDRYLLTAAHCLSHIAVRDIRVLLGHHNVKNLTGVTILKVDNVVPHPDYTDDDPDQKYDIALIRLTSRVKFSNTITPVCLPSRSTVDRNFHELKVAGWGVMRRGDRDGSDTLQEAVVPEVSMETCVQRHHRGRVTAQHICAGNKTVDTCDGDSGGPLMTQWIGRTHVVGITSWGIACAHSYYPAVFTRVSSYAAWINGHTMDAKYCNNRNPFDPYRFTP